MSRPVSVIRAVGALALLLSMVAGLFVASPTLVSAATLSASATSVEAGGVVTLTGTIEEQDSTTYAFYQYSGADCEPGSMVLPAIADGAVVDGAALYTTDVLLSVEGTVSFVFQASDGVEVTETSACVTITVTLAVVIPSPTPEGTLQITKVDQFMSPIPRPAVFRVIEIDEETRVLPPGIEFELGELLNSDAVVSDFVVESTRLITLPVGIYLVTELDAPDGCQPSADTPIVIVLEDDISEAIFTNDCAEPDGSPSPIASPTASPSPGNDDDDNGDDAGADTGDVTQLPETGVGVAANASALTRAAEASVMLMLMLTMMLLGAGAVSWKRSALSRQPSANR